MDNEGLLVIKKIALISMFSDDDLMRMLVLKGGNALDLVYQVDGRSSLDLDFSIENSYKDIGEAAVEKKIERVLARSFEEAGFKAFDYSFRPRPPILSPEMEPFWGGFRIEFKIIKKELFASLSDNFENLRRYAEVVGPRQSRKIIIDISKAEYCEGKTSLDFEGYTIYVYSPAMLFFEKLRAICQQMTEYNNFVKNPSKSARARDFYDIFVIAENFPIEMTSNTSIELLIRIFEAKKVPLALLGLISEYREFHRADFASVKDTVKVGVTLRSYDFYFDYVLDKVQALKSFWIK